LAHSVAAADVTAGLDPAIQKGRVAQVSRKGWMAGSSPAMTNDSQSTQGRDDGDAGSIDAPQRRMFGA